MTFCPLILFTDVSGLEQLTADQWSTAYSMAMLNAAAAAARNQQQQHFSPSPGTASSTTAAVSLTPPTTSSAIQTAISPNSQLQHQLQLGLHTQAQEGVIKQEALMAAQMSPLTVGALLKMSNSGATSDGASGIGNASLVREVKHGGQAVSSSLSTAQTMVAALSGTPSPSPPSSSNAAPLISHHLQQEGPKFGSPSPHHSPNPNPPHHHAMGGQVMTSTGAKRPAPIQIPPGVNRIVDETGAGSGAPTTPASPFTGQQGG